MTCLANEGVFKKYFKDFKKKEKVWWNMVQVNEKTFESIPIKELMEATYKSSENLQVRAFF